MINVKKIIIVTSEFPPEPGGIGNHAYNIAKQLSMNNYKVTVISDQRSEKSNEKSVFDTKLSFKIIRIKKQSIRTLMYLNRIFQIFKNLRKNDLIIASGKFSLWIVALSTLFFKKKINIAIIHGSEVNFRKKILRKTIDISLRKFDHIIAVSNFTKSLISYLKLTNITVIPNGFELSKISITTKEKIKGKPSLITVGSVTKRKGQRNVINALPTLIKYIK